MPAQTAAGTAIETAVETAAQPVAETIPATPAAIAALWESLQRDPRHHDIEVLARGPLEQRRFSDWTMAFSSYPSLNRFNMPGFFAVDRKGMNIEAERYAQA